jgi:site-specific DNA recombinase
LKLKRKRAARVVKKATKAFIYCRVSTEEQANTNQSLPFQERLCRRYCNSHKLPIAGVFIEPGEAATSLDRTELTAMLARCEKEFRDGIAIVVYDMQRLTRETEDYQTLRKFFFQRAIELHFTGSGKVDDSPDGEFFGTVQAALVQLDNRKRAQRSEQGMRERFEQGYWVWQAPLGYRFSNGLLVPDERTAPLVRAIFELASQRVAKTEIRERVTALGLRGARGGPISNQTISNVLKNPIYKGEMRSEEWEATIPGIHEPLVEPALWEHAQPRRQAPNARNRFHPDFPLRRFVKCATCGKSLTGSRSRGRNGTTYPYYRCITAGCIGSIRASELEHRFGEFLECHALTRELLPLVKECLRTLISERKRATVEERQRIGLQIAQNEEQLERLVLGFTAGTIEQRDYTLVSQRLRKTGEALRERFEQLEAPEISESLVEECIDVLADAHREWASIPPQLKIRFQGLVFPSGVTFANDEFGTAEMSPFYGRNLQDVVEANDLASPPGFEPGFQP